MNAITPQILEQFKLIVGSEYIFTDADSIEKYGKDTILNDVEENARCTHCKTKDNAESRIIFVGGSWQAMLGTRMRND